MKVVVDFDKCESNAVCMAAAPEVFEVRDDNFLYVLQEEPPESLRDEGRGSGAHLPDRRDHDRGLSPARHRMHRWITIVVVGASLAGLRAVEALRRDGFAGRLTLVGAEPHEPYDRPPLSKDFLAGRPRTATRSRCAPGPLDELDLDLRLGAAAHDLDVAAHTVGVGDDDRRRTTGSSSPPARTRARCPDQPDLDGVLTAAHGRGLAAHP